MAKGSSYKIQNIVATASLGKPVPLTKLARTQPNTEYNPETFPGLVLRIKEPKSAVLVFSSGNLVCTGTKSTVQVRKVIDEVIKQLKKINVNITIQPKITVQNIVASGTITGSFSDIRLKNKISTITDPFKIINNLDTFYYTPNDLAKSYGFINDKRDIGLNALEVKELLPEVVSLAPFDMNVDNGTSKSGKNYMTLNYDRIVPLLVECIKDLKKEIDELKKNK